MRPSIFPLFGGEEAKIYLISKIDYLYFNCAKALGVNISKIKLQRCSFSIKRSAFSVKHEIDNLK